MKLSPWEAILYDTIIAFQRFTGRWRFPVETNGDYEFMTRNDIIYWLYKAQYPIVEPDKNAGLLDFFRYQASQTWSLPTGFKQEGQLTMTAVGDLMSHPFLGGSSSLYGEVSDIVFGSDFSMANLECVICPDSHRPFTFNPSESSPPLYYDARSFQAAKGPQGRQYDFMSTANNHCLDFGEDGVLSTIAALRSVGILFGGTNEEERQACCAPIVEKGNIRLGLICHTFGLNGRKAPSDKPWLANRTRLLLKASEIDLGQIRKQVQFCRNSNVDLIVAQLHWGLEHEYFPRSSQIELAHVLAEMGFDVIIGHHPHVVQPLECYRTQRDPHRVVPIFYSLGNLITPFSDIRFRRSAVARITVSKGNQDGVTKCLVSDANLQHVMMEIDQKAQKLRLVRSAETPWV